MHGLYPNDASWIDTAGRLLILAFFAIVWLRNLSSHHTEDHIKRLTFFKTPMPRAAFWAGMALDAVGCVLLLVNWHPAVGALCLIVFTVLASLLLSQLHSVHWLWFTAFVGANMLQASFTGFCPLAMILGRLGVKSGAAFCPRQN